LTEFIDNYVVVLDTDTAIKHYENDDFTSGNSDLRAKNTYFWSDNP